MFDSIPTTTQADSSDQYLHQAFIDNPDLFPEVTDPKEREETILGFEQYLKIIDGIFMDRLRDAKLFDISEEDILEEWRKGFRA
jgi:hypothetical protein